jgi:hypothetical protein
MECMVLPADLPKAAASQSVLREASVTEQRQALRSAGYKATLMDLSRMVELCKSALEHETRTNCSGIDGDHFR